MKLIVGLGNPGQRYQKTRHNLGFLTLEALLRQLAPLEKTHWRSQKNLQAEITRLGDLILAKPLLPMNASGQAVRKLAVFFKIKPENLLLVHDDLDLPLGKIKIVENRGAAGHRGVSSVIRALGTPAFIRFRLGVGKPAPKTLGQDGIGRLDKSKERVIDFVLSKFGKKEKIEADRMVKKAVKVIRFALKNGVKASQTRYH